VTHNFGSVDSVAIVLFCAGSKRFCVPHARFLLHGIGLDVPAGARLDEKLLDEKMKSLQIDRENISRVIADNCGKKMEEVDKDMLTGTVLNPEQAENYGLVHEIKSPLFEQGAEVIDITDA
jgi:ATP-dependent Clp protease protease subunit